MPSQLHYVDHLLLPTNAASKALTAAPCHSSRSSYFAPGNALPGSFSGSRFDGRSAGTTTVGIRIRVGCGSLGGKSAGSSGRGSRKRSRGGGRYGRRGISVGLLVLGRVDLVGEGAISTS